MAQPSWVAQRRLPLGEGERDVPSDNPVGDAERTYREFAGCYNTLVTAFLVARAAGDESRERTIALRLRTFRPDPAAVARAGWVTEGMRRAYPLLPLPTDFADCI